MERIARSRCEGAPSLPSGTTVTFPADPRRAIGRLDARAGVSGVGLGRPLSRVVPLVVGGGAGPPIAASAPRRIVLYKNALC